MKNQIIQTKKGSEVIVAYGEPKQQMLEVLYHILDELTETMKDQINISNSPMLNILPIGGDDQNIVIIELSDLITSKPSVKSKILAKINRSYEVYSAQFPNDFGE